MSARRSAGRPSPRPSAWLSNTLSKEQPRTIAAREQGRNGLRRRIFVPREHGAWAMWSMPGVIGAGLADGGYTRAAVFLVAVFLLFWARYPVWVWAISRGRRFPGEAIPGTVLAGAVGLALMLGLVVFADRPLLLFFAALLVPLVVLQLGLSRMRRARDIPAELVGIATLGLTGPGAYYVATGVLAESDALLAWLLPLLFFGTSVFYVRLRVEGYASLRRGRSLRSLVAALLGYQALALAGVGALIAAGLVGAAVALAYAPVTVQITWLARGVSAPPRLPRLGVLWVCHAVLFTVLALVLV